MKKQKKADLKGPINDPAFARIHGDRIRELQVDILSLAITKQLMENARDQYPESAFRRHLVHLRLLWQFEVAGYWWAIRRKLIEIRRLRGWLPN